mmetsp:Transcript_27403/g.84559  ORF Transcript_27403/g.84559 Transcript_27403/m.84559 type:complete len:328 (+) Transcript_27403:745-1728(+)
MVASLPARAARKSARQPFSNSPCAPPKKSTSTITSSSRPLNSWTENDRDPYSSCAMMFAACKAPCVPASASARCATNVLRCSANALRRRSFVAASTDASSPLPFAFFLERRMSFCCSRTCASVTPNSAYTGPSNSAKNAFLSASASNRSGRRPSAPDASSSDGTSRDASLSVGFARIRARASSNAPSSAGASARTISRNSSIGPTGTLSCAADRTALRALMKTSFGGLTNVGAGGGAFAASFERRAKSRIRAASRGSQMLTSSKSRSVIWRAASMSTASFSKIRPSAFASPGAKMSRRISSIVWIFGVAAACCFAICRPIWRCASAA